MSIPDDAPALLCPAIQVPDFEPCAPHELEPMLRWLAGDRGVEAPMAFPRGTALPDGRVDLCKQALGVDGSVRVLEAIDGNGHVRSLLLGTDGLGDRGAAAAAKMIRERRAPALETLYLGCNRIEAAGVEALADALSDDRCPVRALWLKRNPIGPEGAELLAQLLRRAPRLELLDLTNVGLTDVGVAPLADALIEQAGGSRGLQRLLIGSNGVGPEGAARLAEVLAISPHLRELDLGVSNLGDRGARALAAGLGRRSKLERLDLGSCAIGPGGIEALVSGCRLLPDLVELDLGTTPSTVSLGGRDNDLRDESGAVQLGPWLATDPPLRRLNLCGAGLRSRGALVLLDGLQSNRNLVELGLGKYIARRIKRRIRERLAANLAAGAKSLAGPPAHVAAILSVYRTKR